MKNKYLGDVKKRLKKYDIWCTELTLRQQELEDLHDISISSTRFDSIPAASGNVSKVELIAIKNIEKEKYLKEEIVSLKMKIVPVEKGLDHLNEKQYEIAKMKYIKCYNWGYIADTLGYSVSRCKQLGKEALIIIASMVHGSKSFEDLPIASGQGYYTV